MNTNKKLLYTMVCALALQAVVPACAFDLRGFFNSWSQNSRNAFYVGTAAVVAGLGFLAYSLYFKKKSKVVETQVGVIGDDTSEAVRLPTPIERRNAQGRILADAQQEEVRSVVNEMVTSVVEKEEQRVAAIEQEHKETHADRERSERSAELKRSTQVTQAIPTQKPLLGFYKSSSTTFRDCTLDEVTVICKKQFEDIQKACNEALAKVREAIMQKNRVKAEEQYKTLLSLFENEEHKKVYAQIEVLLQAVEAAEKNNTWSQQMSARKLVLVPIKGEIERMNYYYKKIISQDIKNIR